MAIVLGPFFVFLSHWLYFFINSLYRVVLLCNEQIEYRSHHSSFFSQPFELLIDFFPLVIDFLKHYTWRAIFTSSHTFVPVSYIPFRSPLIWTNLSSSPSVFNALIKLLVLEVGSTGASYTLLACFSCTGKSPHNFYLWTILLRNWFCTLTLGRLELFRGSPTNGSLQAMCHEYCRLWIWALQNAPRTLIRSLLAE